MIETHRTISKTGKIFNSGNNPILVECEDFNTWVCKHGRMSPGLLLNELIGSSFARSWNLPTPNFCLIEVSEHHLPSDNNSIQPTFFKKHCFGSQFLSQAKVVDQTTLPLLRDKTFRKKITNKNDYLKIALFDIWLANDDRNPMHTNLLLSRENKDYLFTVFDHDALFNQTTLGMRPLVLLDEECSLISGEISTILFRRNKKLINNVNELVENFYICIENCRQQIPLIMDCIPESWGINKDEIQEALIQSVFSDSWLADCEKHFRGLIQKYI